jgi:hypothetical protein
MMKTWASDRLTVAALSGSKQQLIEGSNTRMCGM